MIHPVPWNGALPLPLSALKAEQQKTTTHLRRRAVKLQQPILETLHFGLELFSISAQQALVESDELQE